MPVKANNVRCRLALSTDKLKKLFIPYYDFMFTPSRYFAFSQNPTLYFGQILDSKNTLPDPVENVQYNGSQDG